MSNRSRRSLGVSMVTIVCPYPDGALPSATFRAVQRTRRHIRRAGYAAGVELLPSSAVPSDAEFVVSPDDLAALLERLVADGVVGHAAAAPRPIAVHRGFQAIGERARLPE